MKGLKVNMKKDTDFEIADLDTQDNITMIDKPTSHNNSTKMRKKKKQTPQINFHIVFFCALVLIIGFAAVRLAIWNKGVKSEYDPEADTSEFDIEVLDSIIPLDPSKLASHEDDGVTTILCLGNDPFALDRGENGLSEQIALQSGATVYNGSFPGTTIAAVNPSYSDSYQLDAFSFSYVARALASGNFDQLKWVAPYVYNDVFPATTELLESIDMDELDQICIMYDGSDYTNKRVCDDPNVPNLITTYTGALRTGIQAIQAAYPHIRITVMSHSFCHWINEEGNFENGDRTDLGHGTLSHYLQKELDACNDCGVSFIDNFYGSVNEDNYLDYMRDNIHFNDEGRKLLASRYVNKILTPNTKQ